MSGSWEQKKLVDRCLDRQKTLETDRAPWEGPQLLIAQMTRPDVPLDKDDKGAFILPPNVYEGSPAHGLQTMTNGLLNNLVSPSIDWRRMIMPDKRLRGNKRVKAYLQTIDELMGEAYRRSNYYEAVHPFMRDGLSVGTAVMMIEETADGSGTYCWVPHYQSRWVMQDYLDRDVVLHIKHRKTLLQISQEYGTDNLPQAMMMQLREGNHTQDYEVLQCVYKLDDPILRDLPDAEVLRVSARAQWVSVDCLLVSDDWRKRPLKVSWYRRKPFIVFHYMKPPGWHYSITPAWCAMSDILRAQDMWKNYMIAGQMGSDPPMYGLASVIRDMEMFPGGRTAVEERQYERPPKSLLPDYRIEQTLDIFRHTNESVDRWFMKDLFLMMNTLVSQGRGPKLATLALQMMGEKAGMLMPTVEKIERVFLRESDERMFDIELNAGRIPLDDMPPEMWESPVPPEPEFVGPLAQTQMVYMSVKRAMNFQAAMAGWLELDPHAAMVVEVPKTLRRLADDLGFWQDCILADDEYDRRLAAVAQQEQQKQLLASGTNIARTISGLQGATEPGSPLAALTGA